MSIVSPARRSEAQAQKPAALIERMPTFGVALFDHERLATTGWACQEGQAPMRFSTPAELSNSTIWFVHLDYEVYLQSASGFGNLRRPDYFRISLRQMCADLGLEVTGATMPQTAQALAQVCGSAMRTAARCYGWRADGQSATRKMIYDELAKDIKNSLPAPPTTPEHLTTVFLGAHQSYSSTQSPRQFGVDWLNLTLRINRMHYARRILATHVPSNDWKHSGPRPSLDHWLDPAQPCVVEATVELSSAQPELAAMIAFGSTPSGQGKKPILRKWISQPELAWLSQYARIQIHGGYVASELSPLPQQALMPEALTSCELIALSYGAGLVAQCHLQALMQTEYVNRQKRASSWSVWLSAIDRRMCFEWAVLANNAGLMVSGYGNGSLTIRLQRSDLHLVQQFCENHGVSYPSMERVAAIHGHETGRSDV